MQLLSHPCDAFAAAMAFLAVFIASDGLAADSELVGFTINEAGNQPPTWSPVNASASRWAASRSCGKASPPTTAT